VADICHYVCPQPDADASFCLATDRVGVNQRSATGAWETVRGEPEAIDWACPATGTYFLILDAYGTDAGGEWTLTYEIACPTPEGVCCLGYGSRSGIDEAGPRGTNPRRARSRRRR